MIGYCIMHEIVSIVLCKLIVLKAKSVRVCVSENMQ